MMFCYRNHSLYKKTYKIILSFDYLLIGENNHSIKYKIELNHKTLLNWAVKSGTNQLKGFSILWKKKWKLFEMETNQCQKLKQKLDGKISYNEIDVMYKPIKQLYQSRFGSLILMKSLMFSQQFSCKTIKKSLTYTEENYLQQVELLSKITHKNIHKIKEAYNHVNSFHLIMDHPKGGSLKEILDNQKIEDEDILQIMKQLLSALQYLHSLGYIHRNITPEHIFLMEQNNFESLVLSDFELACKTNDAPKNNNCCGVLGYAAPELLSKVYNEKFDVFSCGVILYQMLTKNELFDRESSVYDEKMMWHLINHSDLNQQFIDLLTQMLQFDTTKRITLTECLNQIELIKIDNRPTRILDDLYLQSCQSKDEIFSFKYFEDEEVFDISPSCDTIQQLPVIKVNRKPQLIY